MCGRFTLTADQEGLEREFGFKAGFSRRWVSTYNISPSQRVPVLYHDHALNRTALPSADLFHWGLIPSWSKDETIGNRMINARYESVADRPAYRRLFERQRCLVLADGFYEWKKEGSVKTPYYFCLRSRKPFAFAGLWSEWKRDERERIRTFSILTRPASGAVAQVHGRMPVIIPKIKYAAWLNQDEKPIEILESLFKSSQESDGLFGYVVSNEVNSPLIDSARNILPIEQSLSKQHGDFRI